MWTDNQIDAVAAAAAGTPSPRRSPLRSWPYHLYPSPVGGRDEHPTRVRVHRHRVRLVHGGEPVPLDGLAAGDIEPHHFITLRQRHPCKVSGAVVGDQ